MNELETNNSAYRKLAYPTEIKNMMTKGQKLFFQGLHNLIGKDAISKNQRTSYYKLAAKVVLGDGKEKEIQDYTDYRMDHLLSQNVSTNEELYTLLNTLLNQYPLLMTEKEKEEEESIENDHATSIGNQHK